MDAGTPAANGPTDEAELLLALLAPRAMGGPRHATRGLLTSGRSLVLAKCARLPDEDRERAQVTAARLSRSGMGALLCDDPRYPQALRGFTGAPPALFHLGPVGLLSSPAIGVCGSRDAGERAVGAARACGREAVGLNATVVSGYAQGVDVASHLAALEAGGTTIAVLAEGIEAFRLKRPFRDLPAGALSRMLVVSQFPPAQRWTAGAAMTRNQVVVGLSEVVVAIDARESGGTFRAGETALRGRRPLVVVDTSGGTSTGTALLIAAGARAAANREELVHELHRPRARTPPPLPLA